MINGSIEHYDNHGDKGFIRAGNTQWLTAGRGLIHNEQPAAGQTVHLLQLWVNLPKADELVRAHYQDIRGDEAPVRREAGAAIRVFSGLRVQRSPRLETMRRFFALIPRVEGV